jgi:hypothetical protein
MVDAVNAVTGFVPFSELMREAQERDRRERQSRPYKPNAAPVPTPVVPSSIVQISQRARDLYAAEQSARPTWDWDM